MRYERKYIQYNDLVFDGYGMLGEYDASSVSFKVTTHARSFGHGSYAPFKSKNAFVEESSVSLTLWLKEKKLPCDVRPFYRSFVIEQLSKHGKLWAVQDNTLVWAYATVQSYSEMVEHANGKLGIDVDFLLYEGVWHKADKQKTFLHPYDLCSYMECFDYREYQPCKDAYLMTCGDCGEINIDPQTKSGSVVEIEKVNPHDAVASMGLEIEPQQDFNGYDHPWAGGAGKNKLPSFTEPITVNGVTVTPNADGSITLNGTSTATTYFDITENFDSTAYAGYYFSGLAATHETYGGNIRIRICASTSSRTAIQDYYVSLNGTVTGEVVVDNGTGLCLSLRLTSGLTFNNVKYYLMMSQTQGDTFAPYENICPITGFDSANIYVSPTTSVGDATTYNVSFGSAGTVYGGTLDVVSGQLTVERAFITLDETANWNWSTATLRPHVFISGMEIKGAVISNMYPYSSSNVAVDGTITTNAGSGNDVWIYDTVNAPDLNSWKTFVASNNLQVVYTLATPLTYQVSPAQVKLLMGENYIWSDISDITLSTTGYHRDASDGCLTPTPNPHNDRYCCECDCDSLSPDMALCYHLDDLQEVYKECSNAGFRVVYDCEAAERFFNILGQEICGDICSTGTIAGKIYSETDIPTDGVTITLVGNMHNPYVEINGNGNWIAGDYNGRLRIESNGDVYFENGCKCDEPLPPDVWRVSGGMDYGWKILPRYNRVIVNLGACCGKACAYFSIDNLTI